MTQPSEWIPDADPWRSPYPPAEPAGGARSSDDRFQYLAPEYSHPGRHTPYAQSAGYDTGAYPPRATGWDRGTAAQPLYRQPEQPPPAAAPGPQGWPPYHRQEEPAPAPAPAPAAQTRPEPLPALVRGQIVDRMRRANRNHVRAALEGLGTSKACAPYCLTLISVDQSRYNRISWASRLDDDDPDHYSLEDLLVDMHREASVKRAEAHAAGHSWDPRTPFGNPYEGLVLRSEEVTADTELVGVGISMLDVPDESWAVAKRGWAKAWASDRAIAATRTGGQAKIWLVDGTAIHMVRNESTPDVIVSNAYVDVLRPVTYDDDILAKDAARGDRGFELLKKLLDLLLEP